MVLAYMLSRVNPWLLVALTAVVAAVILGALAWAIYQLWRLSRGIGQVIRLIESRPAAGLSVVAEFLIWGSGWLIWRNWARGALRLVLWLAWMAIIVFGIPALAAALGVALAPVPFLEFVPVLLTVAAETTVVLVGLWIGARSARSLMRTFGQVERPVSRSMEKAPAQA